MNSSLHISLKRTATLVSVTLFSAIAIPHSLRADPVVVQEVSTGIGEDVTIDDSAVGNNLEVFAGALNLSVDGAAETGFCIDPWHMSVSGPQNYVSESLTDAPKAPGPMTAAQASTIETLWADYSSPSMSAATAAGLQIAIWETESGMGGDTFSLASGDDYGASTMLSAAAQGGVQANLTALSGPGQDYAVAAPDLASTALLVAFGLVAAAGARKQLRILA